MHKIKYIFLKALLLAAFVFAAEAIHAQDSLNNVEIVVVGTFNATVNDAVKIDHPPLIDPPKLTPPVFTYSLDDKEYKTKPEIVPSKPQSYNSKENEKLYGNYTRIGYGMYNMPLFETYLHNTRSKNVDYGLHYNFLGGEYKKYNQVFNDHDAKAHLTYNLTSLSKLNVHAGYERHRINWYGYDNPDSVQVNLDSTKNIYNNISAGGYYSKAARNGNDMAYGAGVDYFFQNDRFGNKENYFEVKGEVMKAIKNHPLTVPLNIATTSFSNNTNKYSRLFIDINPRYLIDFGKPVLNVGFNSTIFHDSSGGMLYWFPFADFKVKLIDKKLSVHVGIERGMQQNTYASLLKQNPFLDTLVQLKQSAIKNKLFAGIWGSIGSKAAFAVEADFGNYMNMPFFVCDTSILHKYKVIYDDVDIFNVKATLQMQWAEDFKTTLEFGYHNYNPGDQKYYWNMPMMDAKLNLQYNYEKTFSARITAYYIGERYGKNIEFRDSTKASLNSDAVKLPAIIDVNLMLEYHYNKMISVFLNGSNLTNQAYRRWLNYPGYKLSVLGGVAFTF